MSLAQIELLCADCSVTIYPKYDTVKDGKGKEHKFSRPSSQSIREAQGDFGKWDGVTSPTVDISGFSFG